MDDPAPESVAVPPAHTPYYCEENIWHLAADPRVGPGERIVAVLSNSIGGVACFGQRAARELGEPVLWDYHVVLLHAVGARWDVWDLDTTQGLPLPAPTWLRATFGVAGSLPRMFWPRFRLVPADVYRQALVSDRSHMRTADDARERPVAAPMSASARRGHEQAREGRTRPSEDVPAASPSAIRRPDPRDPSPPPYAGGWLHPPPPWPLIGQGPPTLGRLVDLDDPWLGEIVEREELEARLRAGGSVLAP